VGHCLHAAQRRRHAEGRQRGALTVAPAGRLSAPAAVRRKRLALRRATARLGVIHHLFKGMSMTISDELARLGQLHQQGVLNDTEFARAKARVIDAGPTGRGEAPSWGAVNRLRRSRDDRWLGGVCGGIGSATGVASWVWRLMFTLLVLCAGGGLLVYGLMWLLVPLDDGPQRVDSARLHAG
jgi:phage shock protein PspC (stress-responsive transcriptional regulator)